MLAVDQTSSIKTGTGTSLVSDSLTTTIADEMLIAVCTADGFFTGGTGSFTITDNKSNTWYSLISETANGAQVFVFYTKVATIQSGITVTATRSGGSGDGITLQVFSIGASDVAARVGLSPALASISAAAVSKSITTTVANSMVFAAYANSSAAPDNTTQVVGTSQTAVGSYKGTVTHGGAEVWRQTSNTASIGSVTMNLVTPSSSTGAMVAFEIVPSVVSSAIKTGFASSVTSMAVNLPASISSGDLLIAIVEVRNSGTWTKPTGWTQIFAPVAAGGVGDFTAFYKIADGTEGSTATWTASVASTASWQVRKITDWDGTAAPEAATANSGGAVSTNNPPSLTPSWGADNTIWLAVMGDTAQTVSITGAPANYSDITANPISSGGAAVNTGSAYRTNNTATEDPGGFSTGSDRWWVAATIAIKPSSGGSTTTGSITASLQYEVVATPSTVTKSLRYRTTPNSNGGGGFGAIFFGEAPIGEASRFSNIVTSAITKSLQYLVTASHSVTKSLEYTVLSLTSVTKSLIYDVLKTQSITKSLKYTTLIANAITKSLKYTIPTNISITKSLDYTVAQITKITKSLIYDVLSAKAITKSLKYVVLTTGTAITKSLKYTVVITGSAITKSLRYAIDASNAITKSLKYTVINAVSKTKSLVYSIAGSGVDIQKSLKYAVVTQTAITNSLKYIVGTVNNISKSLRYFIPRPSGGGGGLGGMYFGETAFGQASVVGNVITNTITKSLKYAVNKAESITKSLKYTIPTSQAITKSLEYTVSTFETIQKSLIYAIIQATAITKSLVYSLPPIPHAIAKSLEYVAATHPKITKSLIYSIGQTTHITKSLAYSIAGSTAVQKSLKYTVLASVAIVQSLNYFIKLGGYIYYYIKKNTVSTDTKNEPNTAYTDELNAQSTTYTDELSAQDTSYSDSLTSAGTTYTKDY